MNITCLIRDNHDAGLILMQVRFVCCLVECSDVAIRAVEHVIREIKNLTWQELMHLICSTMPMVMASVGGVLDLERAAKIRWAAAHVDVKKDK